MPTMTTFETVTAKRTFPAPKGYKRNSVMTVTAQAYQLGGNEHPHFSVTATIGDEAGGCMHDEALAAWPQIAPIVRLHLANADNGEPMHAEANGFYWLAGAVGGLGEQYHGGSDKTPDECLRILADHLRISTDEACEIANKVRDAYNSVYKNEFSQSLIKYAPTTEDRAKAARTVAKHVFADYVNAQRDRWEREAQVGVALIKELAK